jgi:hypothetical protein
MTTEAVVINRIGVALATDSAVTITGRGKYKVFDTADKLFEFDLTHPVGLMINGNMDWLGVPWELIIKDFRERPDPERKESLQDSLRQFLEFARNHKAYSEEAERAFVKNAAIENFEMIKELVQYGLLESEEPDDAVDIPAKVLEIIRDEASQLRDWFAAYPQAESLAGLTAEKILDCYSEAFDALIKQRFTPVEIPEDIAAILKNMVALGLLSTAKSGSTTGIVVAGFAPGDLFPSLAIAEVNGAVCGRLKFSPQEGLTIDRTDNPGRVISFAQTDVAERLLSGADQRFVSKTAKFISESLGRSKDSVVTALTKAGMNADDAGAVFDVIINETGQEFENEFAKEAMDEFQTNFNEMIALMPKQETIELAEALVSITAIERKASSEQATVGGPIDVAFITRHEGFVWIRRKHYFEKDLNPRYFTRRFSQPAIGGPA